MSLNVAELEKRVAELEAATEGPTGCNDGAVAASDINYKKESNDGAVAATDNIHNLLNHLRQRAAGGEGPGTTADTPEHVNLGKRKLLGQGSAGCEELLTSRHRPTTRDDTVDRPTTRDGGCECPQCECDSRGNGPSRPTIIFSALLARAEWAAGVLEELSGEADCEVRAASHYRASVASWGGQAVGWMSLGAVLWKRWGRSDESHSALRTAAQWDTRAGDRLDTRKGACPLQASAARAALHLLALQHLVANERRPLRAVMQRLGASYTLSPALFDPTAAPKPQPRLLGHYASPPTSSPPLVAYCDDALPEPLLRSVEDGLAWSSCPVSFWRQHSYGHPSTPYHSYLYHLSSQPSNAIESAVQALRVPLGRRWPRLGAEAVAVEWWVHARHPSEGHQLHFDLDEASASSGCALRHPIYSSVLFLSSTDAGPTIVSSQKLGDGGQLALEAAAVLVSPRRNRLLLFDGALLHGVLPSPASSSGGGLESEMVSSCGHLRHRITLMLAWHGKGVACAGMGAPLGPLRLLDPHAPWVAALHKQGLFQAVPGMKEENRPSTEAWVEPAACLPVWEHISELGDAGEEVDGEGAEELPTGSGVGAEGLRYLLSSLHDFDMLYLHGGAALA